MAAEYEPLNVDTGRFSDDTDPGMADTAQQVRQGLVATAAAHVQAQAQSAAFIVEHGAQVLAGHSPVNPAPGQFLTAPAPDPVYDAGTD